MNVTSQPGQIQGDLPNYLVLKIFSAIVIISPISPLFIFKLKSQEQRTLSKTGGHSLSD